MNRSPEVGELTKALAAAQLEMQNPGFDSQNPHFRSKFASLASVRNAVVPVLAKHGLTLTQDITNGEKGPKITTLLKHGSGQWEEYGPLEMPVSKSDAQGVGSAITYGRRYHMMAVAGVVGDEDDDGNAASKPKTVAEKVVAADIKPTAGVLEALSDDDRLKVDLVASLVVDAFESGDEELAYSNWSGAELDSDQKVAAWSLLTSKMRSTLKRLKAEREHVQA